MIRTDEARMKIWTGDTLAPKRVKPSEGSIGGRFLYSLPWASMTMFWRMIDMPTALMSGASLAALLSGR